MNGLYEPRFIKIDYQDSTITILDRRFPAVALLCPEHDAQPPYESVRERALGGWSRPTRVLLHPSFHCFIPAENGALIDIEWSAERPDTLDLTVRARTCYLAMHGTEQLWLPHCLAAVGPFLVSNEGRTPYPAGNWHWVRAEPEWAIEHIDRLARLPVEKLEGPQVQLLTLRQLEELDRE